MGRMLAGLAAGLCFFCSCNGDDKAAEESATGNLAGRSKTVSTYQLTDTGFMRNSDTASIAPASIQPYLNDSAITAYFGRTKNIRYVPLANVKKEEGPTVLILKATAGTKKAALALALDADNKPVAAMPFLLPDADPSTSQAASVDKNLTITKTITKRENNEVVGEGKEVYAFDAKAAAFSLVVLDPLDDDATASRNPIDTFPKTNRLAGDYLSGKKGIVSVRDGRQPNSLLVYIHTENASGDCVGQMKGEFTMTSTTTAAFRQGGDPCVLNLSFKGSAVTIAEASGCGNYRDLDCPFTGTFTRKKAAAPKPAAARPRRG